MIVPRASLTTVAVVATVIRVFAPPSLDPHRNPASGLNWVAGLAKKWLCTSERSIGDARRAASNHNGLGSAEISLRKPTSRV
jgi:hypothetical protein